MIGLLDCNNFYVSCERLFNPKLLNRAVVVLSNNDGCIISRSNEAKKMGIKMGEPFFKIKELIRSNKVSVLSSNYTFYADISNRIMSILKKNLPYIEVYSIDEAFFLLDISDNRENFCHKLAEKIFRWTGIPVSIGLAKTKTLAKIANRVIKKKDQYKELKLNYSNVFELNPEKQKYVLEKTNITDIWGIGIGLSSFLINNKIKNAFQLSNFNEDFARKKKGIILLKTILELKGTLCNEIQDKFLEKKSICVSRSFGRKLNCFNDIKSALIVYVQKACSKMRSQKLFCGTITIFLKTSKYQTKKYVNSKTYKCLEATNDTRLIWKVSKGLLLEIYRKNFFYNKVGVILSDLCSDQKIQQSLLSHEEKNNLNEKKKGINVMNVVDRVNERFGYGKLRLSSDTVGSFFDKNKKKTDWSMKSNYRSPCYTTKWCDIPKIKV